MPPLPPSSDFNTALIPQGAFKTATSAQRSFLASLLGEDGTIPTALATLGVLGGSYVAKTAAYTLSTADRGALIGATGTWTLGLPTATSAGAGFTFALRNSGSGTVTIDPAGSEVIDGQATLDIAPGQGSHVVSTGSAWVVIGPARAVLLDSAGDMNVGSGALAVDASTGNVGIGTASPGERLHVVASGGGIANAVRLTNSSGDGNRIAAQRALVLAADYDNNSGPSSSYIAFEADATEVLRITSAGRVGMGTSTPDYDLHVVGKIGFAPGSSVTPVNDGDLVIEATSNTSITFRLRGSDSIVRSGTLGLT